MRKNRKRHTIISVIIVIVIGIAIMACGNIYISHRLAEERSRELESLVGFLRERCPELSETEIVEGLQGKLGDSSVGHELLEKYGYDDEYYKLNMSKGRLMFLVWNGAVMIAAMAVVLCLFLIQRRRQRERLDEIAAYLHELNNKDYSLKLDDNAEDELSLLRNEIYKTTVLLRETSEYEAQLNANLQRSMEDISHQLRTPLASITIMLDNIYDDPDMPADMRQDFIHSISMQISWMSSLINSMLKLAKFDAGTIKLQDEEIDVDKLIADALNKLSVIIELRNVEIVLEKGQGRAYDGWKETDNIKQQNEVSDSHGDIDNVEGKQYTDEDGIGKDERIKFVSKDELIDRNEKADRINKIMFHGDYNWQLEAVANIIKNAVEHSHDEGRVWISASKNDVYTEIVVRDEGEGMSEEDIKHIFERFYRAKNAGAESIGIGLSLAKCIVEADNGYITVESQLDKGTEFRIRYVRKV
ncbi:MAG: HAMP domain-containing histidine kinase [Lachnospiraceae bacterium]|nr:HAMP domain-containing histidine kinase [Lachnospiraceae bacterium]